MMFLAIGLVIAAVASAAAPMHPVYNPAVCKFVLAALALTAAMFAWEGTRQAPRSARDPDEIGFAVSFDDQVISLANPDGSTERARWDELESISIQPYDDPYLIWTGPYFVVLHVGDRRLLIPALTTGLNALMERLLELPGVDQQKGEALLAGEQPSPCVLWTRDKGP
jgi:hypothetical protein